MRSISFCKLANGKKSQYCYHHYLTLCLYCSYLGELTWKKKSQTHNKWSKGWRNQINRTQILDTFFAVVLIMLSLQRDFCQAHEQDPGTAHRFSLAGADTAHKPCTGSFWKMGPKCCVQSRDTWMGHGAGNNSSILAPASSWHTQK